MDIKSSWKTALALIAAVFLVLVFRSTMTSVCESTVIKVAASPSGQLEANLVASHCPGQPDTVLELELKNKSRPKEALRVAIGKEISENVKLLWLSEDRLAIEYPDTFQISQFPMSIDGVHLEFKAQSHF